MRMVRVVLSAQLLFAAIYVPSAFGQTTPDLEEGMKPYGDFYGGDFDQVSLSSGKLILNIPLMSYSQRGGKIKLGFGLRWQNITPRQREVYYSNTDTYVESTNRDANTASTGQLDFVDNLGWVASGGGSTGIWSPDNNQRSMLYDTSTSAYESSDASGLSYSTTANTLILPDGVRYIYSYGSLGNILSKVEDPNGNFVNSTINGVGKIITWTDTLGRSIPTPLGATSTNDYSHCTGANPISSASTWIVPGPNGGSETFKFCYANYSYYWQSDIGGAIATFQGTLSMLQSIVLPNLTNWTFRYEPTYAALSQITLPTGGTISYTWSLQDAPCQYSQTYNSLQQTTTTKWGWYLAVASRTVNANDGTGAHTWTYGGGTITDPLGNQSVHTMTGLAGTGSVYETQAKYYQGSSSTGTLLKTVNTDYSWSNYTNGLTPLSCQNVISVVPIRVTTVWSNGQTTKQETDYDSGFTSGGSAPESAVYGQVVAHREYDYGNGSPGPLLRQTKTTYVWQSNSNYLAQNLLAYPSSTQVLDGSGVQRAYTFYYYDQYSLASSGISTQHDANPPNGSYRANRTSVARWLNGSVASTTNCPISVSNGYLYSYNLYFDTGTVQKATDSCGNSAGDPNHTTTFAYSSTYAGAWPTTVTNALSQSTSRTYDFNTGAVTSRTDPNNQTTNYKYNDSLGRLTEVDYPDSGVTKNFYTDTPLAANVETQRQIDSSRWTDSFGLYNGLAHPVVHSAANDEATPWDRTDTCYDALGRAQFTAYAYQGSSATSAPNCSGVGDSFTYDGLGRITQVTHSDGSTVLTAYTGRATQVQDEGNGTRRVSRISQVDGLGRLASVCEVTSASQLGSGGTPASCGLDISATGFLTTYGYDALGNLTSVSQSGLNGRTFQYDSLSRLSSPSNPESGTTSFGYDANGNVISKTDARGITTTFAYDFLNRVTAKTYSDSTPSFSFLYDVASTNGVSILYPVGRLVRAASGCVQTINSYDKMGRVTTQWLNTPSYCGPASFIPSYSYDLAGNMISSTNAAGVTFNYTVNRAPRLTTMTSSLVDSNHPGTLFSAAHYNAAGSMLSGSLGTVISETRTYDPRLRLASIADGSNYSLTIPSSGGYAPNSDILAANDSVNGNWAYSYDDFNRLSGSNKNSGQSVYSYVYDRFGNRWQQNGPYSMQLSFSGANNRMDGYSYDAAGNLLSDGSHSYTYDAENRITQVDGGSTAAYVYDANGQRVQKTTSSGTVSYVYDLAGHQVAEFNSSGGWNSGEVYAGSRHLATYNGGTTYFIHPDWLGTERARSNVSGGLCETITSLPFGDGQSTSGACSDASPMHFTGQMRDTESNLDYFGARYYSSQLGRFAEADKPFADQARSDPQSWNLYAYVRNNPLRHVDPTGQGVKEFWEALKNAVIVTTQFGAGKKVEGSLGGLKLSAQSGLITEQKSRPLTDKPSETTTNIEKSVKGQLFVGSVEYGSKTPLIDPKTGAVYPKTETETTAKAGTEKGENPTVSGFAATNEHEIPIVGVAVDYNGIGGGVGLSLDTEELSTAVSELPSATAEALSTVVDLLQNLNPFQSEPSPPSGTTDIKKPLAKPN
jgi:RHS repeat-associated protein